ncbi:hypothetical protein ACFYZJ_09450 [Streptomyces sp. NPDC001848]|uniref:hypothetical protein n=1 Tax=Streptomyces sp. NPDC001848 TaxID=3364618 RepID=UPI0036881D26
MGGRWRNAAALLGAAEATDAAGRARIALAAVEVALDQDWFTGTSTAGERLRTAEKAWAESGAGDRWDLDFLWLRHDYLARLRVDGQGLSLSPRGKDPEALAALRRRVEELRDRAPGALRAGWAEMYLGLIQDNLFAERATAPTHYERALSAGERGDDLLAREALRHLGDHDHDAGDHARALERWQRATALGARAGAVCGTLSQQMLLAVLARDRGDEAGATSLATEIARWAGALGAGHLETQARNFLAGVDPTAPPEQ